MINTAGADKTRPVRRRQPTHRLQQSQKLSWPKQLNHKQASFLRSCPTGADPSQFTSSGLGRDLLNSNVAFFVMVECYPKACLLRLSSYLGFGHLFLWFTPKKWTKTTGSIWRKELLFQTEHYKRAGFWLLWTTITGISHYVPTCCSSTSTHSGNKAFSPISPYCLHTPGP